MVNAEGWYNNFDDHLCDEEFYDRIELESVSYESFAFACLFYENHNRVDSIVCCHVL